MNINVSGTTPNRQLRILSHNPLVPVLVPTELINKYQSSTQPSEVVSAGALTVGTTKGERRWDTRDALAKLVLQVAHRCNLTCAYCISDAGKWGSSDDSMMKAEVAAKAVRFFAEQFGSIGTIYLFGGEPTLNLNAIEAACREAEDLVARGVLDQMPDLGFTSNGTVASVRLVGLLKKYPNLKMSVSIDGPAEIHDIYRLDVKSRPTYEKVVNNIRRLREETGRPKTLEVTYNLSHRRSGMSLWEIMNALREDTGVNIIGIEVAYNTSYSNLNFDPLVDDLDGSLDDIEDALSRSIQSISSTDSPLYYYHIIAFMQVLFQSHKPNFCPAARNYFTVANDGAIYPCQNLPETPETLIGRLDDPDLNVNLRHNPVIAMIDEANRHADDELGEQWFANFCKVCPAYNLGETKAFDSVAPSRVRLYKRMAETFLTGLLQVAEDEKRHARFLDNVARSTADTFELNMF